MPSRSKRRIAGPRLRRFREAARHPKSNLGPLEFHREKWEAAYVKRIDAAIAALKSASIPVFWVSLPAQPDGAFALVWARTTVAPNAIRGPRAIGKQEFAEKGI
jgi:hypothetical protein